LAKSGTLVVVLVNVGQAKTDLSRLLARVEAEARELPNAAMQVTPDEGALLTVLVGAVAARNALEIGTFTGYSSLSMAEALPPGGRIVTCDISDEHVAIAREHIGASPYADRIEIRLGPAQETVESLPGPFDLVFIDADKGGYLGYYEAVLPKLAPGGVIAVDNVLWSGRVLDPTEDDADTTAIRAFNDMVAADDRVDTVMLPLVRSAREAAMRVRSGASRRSESTNPSRKSSLRSSMLA